MPPNIAHGFEINTNLGRGNLRKEVKTMKYAKPEVVSISTAFEAIQTSQLNKATQLVMDVHIPDDPTESAGAYEADE